MTQRNETLIQSALFGLGTAVAATGAGLWLEFHLPLQWLGIDSAYAAMGHPRLRTMFLPPSTPGAIAYLLTLPVALTVVIHRLGRMRRRDGTGIAKPVGWATSIAFGTALSLWSGGARIAGAELLTQVMRVPTAQISSQQELGITVFFAALGMAGAGLWLFAHRFEGSLDRALFVTITCMTPFVGMAFIG